MAHYSDYFGMVWGAGPKAIQGDEVVYGEYFKHDLAGLQKRALFYPGWYDSIPPVSFAFSKSGTREGDKIMKILTHNRDSVGDFQKRVLMHIPAGMLCGIPLLGYPFLQLFINYERNEDAHTSDEAWKDYFGALVGAAITELLVLGLLYLFIKGAQ